MSMRVPGSCLHFSKAGQAVHLISRVCYFMFEKVCNPLQAVDARRFAHDPNDAAVRQQALFAEQAHAALAQTPGHPVPLEEQVKTRRQRLH